MSVYLDDDRDLAVRRLLAAGLSIRKVAELAGVSKGTVLYRKKQITTAQPKPKKRKSAWDCCDHCGDKLPETREFHRRTRRTKHKFCSHDCYCAYYSELRDGDRCALCGRTRRELSYPVFNRSMCGYYYGVMHRFGFNKEAAQTHILNQQLKRLIQIQKHSTNGDASGDLLPTGGRDYIKVTGESCPCESTDFTKMGKDRNGTQRLKCKKCGRTKLQQ